MDRRVFLFSVFALAGCAPGEGDRVAVVCDPELGPALGRALAARAEPRETVSLTALPPRALVARAEAEGGLVVVTREARIADRLQRLGLVRLQNRWKPYVGDAPVQIVVTTGDGGAERRGVRLAKWLAGDEAAARLAGKTPVIFTVP